MGVIELRSRTILLGLVLIQTCFTKSMSTTFDLRVALVSHTPSRLSMMPSRRCTRELLLEREAQTLAPYAVLGAQSRGRLFVQTESEHRTPFQRDRDRVVHTTAFRRLEHKTQVFVNVAGDYYRTRLTHTLEVSQVARTLAIALNLNETLTETLALAHDLGHPPFGHAGESILNLCMTDHGGFDHNHQSFRVVSELEQRYADHVGLNLCWETLEGLVKHHSDLATFPSYAQAFEPTWRPTLESQVADIADSTAYHAHDLDDGLRSGLIQLQDLNGLAIWERLCAQLGIDRVGEFERHVLIRELLGLCIHDLIYETERRLNAYNINTLADVRACSRVLVGHSDELARELAQLRRFLFSHLYHHSQMLRQVQRAEHFIGRLFEVYCKRPELLAPERRRDIGRVGLERAVCDYLAGMTDRFATDEYARFFEAYPR